VTTRHYQHPDKPITHPGVTIRTLYGSSRPILQAEGTRQALDAMQERYNLKRVYPLAYRTM